MVEEEDRALWQSWLRYLGVLGQHLLVHILIRRREPLRGQSFQSFAVLPVLYGSYGSGDVVLFLVRPASACVGLRLDSGLLPQGLKLSL